MIQPAHEPAALDASLLRLGLWPRLALALALLVPLWMALWWALG